MTVDSQLLSAIEAGNARRTLEDKRRKDEVEKYYKEIREDPAVLFDLITDAIARGCPSIIVHGSAAFFEAISRIKGLSVHSTEEAGEMEIRWPLNLERARR